MQCSLRIWCEWLMTFRVTSALCDSYSMYSVWNPTDNYSIIASVFLVQFNDVTHMLIPCYVQILTLLKPYIPASFNMNLVISKCVKAVKVSNFSGHYLRNRSTLDIGVLGYIGIF
jgi:hypothetical protein